MDEEGYVAVPQEPGMGYKFKWDYIEENRIVE
jgi:L-alanine-DL-glutamate epimerase-like enolase superfamily enzyme